MDRWKRDIGLLLFGVFVGMLFTFVTFLSEILHL